ncbi:hypothetical protein AMECASPLE_002141 [Ameca splendens]|uniref:Uncharacterized protein n=1 Tax=Ameca splendens TaxID=208324 RepID=A0ABV1A5C2_9TELE
MFVRTFAVKIKPINLDQDTCCLLVMFQVQDLFSFTMNLRWDEQYLFCQRKHFLQMCQCDTCRFFSNHIKVLMTPFLSAFLLILEKSYHTTDRQPRQLLISS